VRWDENENGERASDMKIGMVGLGKMGANMTQRLIE
jgi:phosphoglycerate dehydrogenase-like enzyme